MARMARRANAVYRGKMVRPVSYRKSERGLRASIMRVMFAAIRVVCFRLDVTPPRSQMPVMTGFALRLLARTVRMVAR
jgi:hypothetical protein